MSDATPSGWWMYHGDPAHTGFTDQSKINSGNVAGLKVKHDLTLNGPVMSVPAISGGYVYVGTANSKDAPGSNGGTMFKINLETGATEAKFTWPTLGHEGDTHGFTGMACTPAVVGNRVYYSAFDGKLYCLDSGNMQPVWITDLRRADLEKNQPVTNTMGVNDYEPAPQAEGWCSPLVVNGKVYVGMGEGENPYLYAFIYCLNADTGVVEWIYCTCKYNDEEENLPNVLPREVVDPDNLPSMYSIQYLDPIVKGCVVWSAIAYDEKLNRIYAATGNPQPENPPPPFLPAPGYAYGILSLDADTGDFKGFYQADPDSSYRVSDLDIDFGASPTLYDLDGRRVFAVGCKNGGLFVIDAETMECIKWRNILPYDTENKQIPTVDPHGPDTPNNPNPVLTNEESNATPAENFHGTYSTPAVHPGLKRLFIGSGGNNYHYVASGIDYETTPFLRVVDWGDLKDAWPLNASHPTQNGGIVLRYGNSTPPMYTTPGEAGLASPAVVNDVVFMSTSRVALYAFDANTGKMLWEDRLGNQTGGFKGGYGYCLGPAAAGDYVVAGALVFGTDGGVLRIYSLG
ncbi:MAG: PQQ-binding-like beta-propeller repeat protein [Acidobacteriota bacterium]|nr:PQQ-binding-like beta-propeller repeat protein [Acidobacteriota bacterium]